MASRLLHFKQPERIGAGSKSSMFGLFNRVRSFSPRRIVALVSDEVPPVFQTTRFRDSDHIPHTQRDILILPAVTN